MIKFLNFHQMVSHPQVLVRSLMRKQTLGEFLFIRDIFQKMMKFLNYHQMVSHLQVLVRSLMSDGAVKRQATKDLEVFIRDLSCPQRLVRRTAVRLSRVLSFMNWVWKGKCGKSK